MTINCDRLISNLSGVCFQLFTKHKRWAGDGFFYINLPFCVQTIRQINLNSRQFIMFLFAKHS